MTTVVNNPGDGSGESSGVGLVLGIIVAIVLVGAFVVYALPAMMGNSSSQNVGGSTNVSLPNTGGSAPAPTGGFTY
jgi:hypothetical protein